MMRARNSPRSALSAPIRRTKPPGASSVSSALVRRRAADCRVFLCGHRLTPVQPDCTRALYHSKFQEDSVARRCALAMLVIVVLSAPPAEAGESILVRHPTISRDRIVFCYAGDLWSRARVGGDAVRLTAGVGE